MSLAWQVSDAFLKSIDTALRAGVLATPSMGLFTNTPSLSNLTPLSAFTEPTYTGYARTAMTLNAQRQNPNGDYIDSFTSVEFQPTANTLLPQTVNGYFVTATVSMAPVLLGAEYFDTPFTFLTELSGLGVIFENMIKNLLTWGGYCAAC